MFRYLCAIVLGTGFALLQPGWIVTAKHVVVRDEVLHGGVVHNELPRNNLGFHSDATTVAARVHAVHPEFDLAVVELQEPLRCKTPLFPSFAGFTAAEGLLSIGYSPSLTAIATGGRRIMQGYPIARYKTEVHERRAGTAEVIEFEAPLSEGGNSGSPVFGTGGGVVGVVVQHFTAPNGIATARAISLAPLLSGLLFCQEWRVSC